MISHKRANTTCVPLRTPSSKLKRLDNQQNEHKLVEFRIIKPIGAGSFGKVYMVKKVKIQVQNKDKQIYAMKVVAQKSGVK